MLTAIVDQESSSVTAAFPAAYGDVVDIQAEVTALRTDLLAWYTAWRGAEPAEPATQSFLGVFNNSTSFVAKLEKVSPVTRMIRNDYTTMSMLAMAYEELYSIAVALDKEAPGLMDVALDGLKAIVPVIQSLSETMCTVTIRELHNEDSTIPMSDAAVAISATQIVWNT